MMSVFHYALKNDGFLFLGSSETVSGHGDLFKVLDSKHRIAQRKTTGAKSPGAANLLKEPSLLPSSHDQSGGVDLGAISQRILLDEFAPPYAIVDEQGQVVYLSQRADSFLHPPEGEFVNNIFRMARIGLRVGLRTAWAEAKETKRKAIYEGLSVELEGKPHQIRLTVQPLPELGSPNSLYFFVFQSTGIVLSDQFESHPPQEAEKLVEKLESELVRTRDELERVVQDLEAANEELKSSNEELLSMNEELRSSNEELESSKEEIEVGSQALASANLDLQNLFHSTEIATIFIDQKGKIRGFTPAISLLINVVSGDIGRPLKHFTHQFESWQLPDISNLNNLKTRHENEVTTIDGRTFLQRITPYRDAGGLTNGIVVTFIDITVQKETQLRLAKAEQDAADRLAELESIYASAPVGLALLSTDFRYTRINQALADMNGFPPQDHLGKSVRDIVPGFIDIIKPAFDEVLSKKALVGPMELTGEIHNTPDQQKVFLQTWSPVHDRSGEIMGVNVSALDITERKKTEASVAMSEARLRRLIDNLVAFVGVLNKDGVLVESNAALIDRAGLDAKDVIGKPFWDCYWWSFSDSSQNKLRSAFNQALNGEVVRYDTDIRIKDSRMITIDFQLAPLKNDQGDVIEIVPSAIDISERLLVERQRELLHRELNHRVKNTLATIQGIAVISLKTSQSPDHFKEGFLGRIQAIGRAHDIVTVGGVLADLIKRQVKPYTDNGQQSLILDGPEIILAPDEAHKLGLIFHELATNATKYGALSTLHGFLSLSWSLISSGRVLRIQWVENGGPVVHTPPQTGFGFKLINQIMTGLSGHVTYDYAQTGVSITMDFPLSQNKIDLDINNPAFYSHISGQA